MKYKYILFTLIFSILFNCSLFNVTSLKPNKFTEIKAGTEPGEIHLNTDKFGIQNISFSIGIFDNMVGIADNSSSNARFQLIDNDGQVKLLIGDTKNVDQGKVTASKFNFSTIGSFLIGDDGNIYIQNRFSYSQNKNKYKNNKQNDSNDFSPSYILVFNKEGVLQYTLGKNGAPDIPFNHIEGLDVDSNGKLIVISRTYDVWNVYGYINKKQQFSINLGMLQFPEQDDQKYDAKIEKVNIYNNGEKLLLSVAFYDGMRFKYRKIYDYSIKKQAIIKTILNLPDPKNVLFNFVNEKLLYFWNMDEDEVRFMICDLEGTIMNNIKLIFKNKHSYYTNIISDRSGNIYSYHVLKNKIEIYKWE